MVRIDGINTGSEFAPGVMIPGLALPEEVPARGVSLMSKRVEDLLLEFVAGSWGRDYPVHRSHRFETDEAGLLVISENERFFRGEIDWPGWEARLEWLNGEGILPILGDTNADSLMMLGIRSVIFHPDDIHRVKVDYSIGTEDYVIEARRENGVWIPRERWSREDYYLIDGVFHNSSDFRPE